jgi:hypothetical protein
MDRMVILLFFALSAQGQVDLKLNRPQKLAAVKASSILPHYLARIIRKYPKELLAGVDAGFARPSGEVSRDRLLAESEKITQMVDNHAPFAHVVWQMGFVSGLLAVYTDPANSLEPAHKGAFSSYCNLKLPRFLFVFPGWASWPKTVGEMRSLLDAYAEQRTDHARVLGRHYSGLPPGKTVVFPEQHPVFGVGSLYFSNLAGLSARLWRHAWHQASGDAQLTPFEGEQRSPVLAPAVSGK